MQYFYVKSDIVLRLPHKEKLLLAPTPDQLAQNSIPLDRIYCGFVAWEYICAQQQLGSDKACLVNPSMVSKSVLPLQIKSFEKAGVVTDQLQTVLNSKNHIRHAATGRVALINGTGTMLGDNVVGASVLERVIAFLKTKGFTLEIDVFVAWNARPGVESIWKQTPSIHRVFGSSPTIAELQQYDAFWDFSHLLQLEGYSTEHFGDCYFNHFGVDPTSVPLEWKVPVVRVNRQALVETQKLLDQRNGGNRMVFIQPEASTKARSMPATFLLGLIKRLSKIKNCIMVMSGNVPSGLTNYERKRIINLQDWTKNDLDRYFSAIAQSQYIISVDTLALHVAMGCQKCGVGLFALSEPSIRLKYSPRITGMLIPAAQNLPYWEKHKSDENWDMHKTKYENAWLGLSMEEIVQNLHISHNFMN